MKKKKIESLNESKCLSSYNFSILCTGIFLIHLFFHTDKISSIAPLKYNVLSGLLQGLFGILLMHFGIHIGNGVLIDLRSIPMMITAQVGGWVATCVATIIIISCRLIFYPISHSSLVNIIVLALSAIAFSIISYTHIKKESKWLYMAVAFILIMGTFIRFAIPDSNLALMVFSQYSFAIACATFGTYMITNYLWRSRANYDLLKESVQKDYLTGLNNTRSFHNLIQEDYVKAMKKQADLSLLMIDIDYFKHINDTYGHPGGDDVLKQIGYILEQSCRNTDKVSRIGGEEFSILMPSSNSSTARKLAKRIQKAVEQNVFYINENREIRVTVSIGYATANNINNISVKELINQADEGLYLAKRSGRNQVSHIF